MSMATVLHLSELTKLSNGINATENELEVLHLSELTKLSNDFARENYGMRVLHLSELTKLSNDFYAGQLAELFYIFLN